MVSHAAKRRAGEQGKFFRRSGVKESSELRRIVNLPRRQWEGTEETQELIELLTREYRRPGGTMVLRAHQAVCLADAHDWRGLLAPVRVAGGKTLISFLLPLVLGIEDYVLVVPGALKRVTERKWWELSVHWKLPPLSLLTYNILSRAEHAGILFEMRPKLFIGDEFHKLKNKRAACTQRVGDYMDANPDTIMCGMSGTITNRSIHEFEHLAKWCLPKTCPVPRDYGALVEFGLCMDENKGSLNNLHPGALTVLYNDDERALAKTDALTAVRRAYQRRLTETPGVVSTTEKGVNCSLIISALDVPGIDSKEIGEAFSTLRKHWRTPDGHPFSEASKLWAHARELTCGFYYRWFNFEGFNSCVQNHHKLLSTDGSTARKILNAYANTTVIDGDLERAVAILKSTVHGRERTTFAQGTDSQLSSITNLLRDTKANATSADVEKLWQLTIATKQIGSGASYAGSATERLGYWVTILKQLPGVLDTFASAFEVAKPPKKWLKACKEWHAFVNHTIGHNQRGYYTEFQVALACSRGEYPDSPYATWVAIRDEFKPNSVPVWVHDKTIVAAAKWLENNDGICWVEHRAFGERLADYTGLPYFRAGGLDKRGVMVEDASGPIIASVLSNKEGRDLQFKWSKNLIVSCAPNGEWWEQLLGRTHRDGQEEDEVTADVVIACSEQFWGFQQALRDAKYQTEFLKQPRKLTIADINMPAIEEISRKKEMRWNKTIEKADRQNG